jgi:hypothetical protein
VRAVVDPASGRLDELAGGDHRSMPDKGDQVAMAARFDPEHTKAIVGVVECDAIDQTG